jgi:hypothetical protein
MSSATAPLLGPGGFAPAQPKHGRLALLSASLLLASAIFFDGRSGGSRTGLRSWDAARRHRAAEEAADDTIGASSPTGLWSWGDAWSTLHRAADRAANGTSSAVKSALNSSAAHRVEHGIEQGAGSAEHEAEHALNSSSAARAAKSKLDQVGGRVANYTADLSPQCVRALELGAVVATGTLAAPALVEAVGFTSEGVAAESLASLWQSTIGDVEEGSIFARLQSLGASGVVAQTSLRAAGIEGVLAVAYCDAASAMCSSCNISVLEKQGDILQAHGLASSTKTRHHSQ